MAAHLTEEEQIAALKRWWESNGKLVVAAILIVVIGWFGWSSWQDRQERIAQEASRQYTELMTVINAAPGGLSDKQKATAKLLASEIVESQPGSLYGNLSALMFARLAVDGGDLAEAESRLRALVGNAANTSMASLANLRLARVLSAQGNHEAALAILGGNVEQAYQAAYAEARGDVHMAQDQLAEAHTAYQQALAALGPQQSGRSGVLQLKLNNTRVAGGPAEEEEAAPAAEGGA